MADDGVDMEPFSLLAHEIRLDIIRAFFNQWDDIEADSLDDAREKRGLRYSTLMDAIGMQDSGKFNYHLEQLLGVYVEQVGEQYVPTASSIALYHAVLANRPTENLHQDEVDIDASCPACGEPILARYDQEYLIVDCEHCDDWWGLRYPFPKNGLDSRAGTELLDALDNRAMYDIGLARTGQCPSCAGHVSIELAPDRLDGGQIPTVSFSCGTCFWGASLDVLNALRFDPRVAAALTDLGVVPEAENANDWLDEDAELDVTGEAVDEDGQIAVRIKTHEGTATVDVDDDLSVLSVDVEMI